MSDAASEKQRALQQIEEVLQDSERLFRAAWEHASDAMALSTPDGTVFAANLAYFHLYGYSSEDVIGNNFSIIIPEEYRTSAQEMYGYFFQSPTISTSVESPIRRADGTECFVESRYTFITDQGQRIAMLSIVRDITDQKRAKEALWISEEKLRIALKVGHMESWDWDISSNTIHWSTKPEVASGLVQGSFSASYETFLELVHPQDRTLIDQELKRALEEGTDYTLEFRLMFADGTVRWTRIQGQVLYNEAGKPLQMMGISMDVTQGR
jgi:PAS domain S-box-containing protein